MASTEIHGGQVVYELLGPPGGQPVVLTPGGRFSKDVPGLRPLAEALAAGGLRVLLWDRPNTGASDVQFYGRSESHMRADTLAELLAGLDLAPAVIAGGSGGARDSLLTVIRHPEVASKAIAWSIVGGVFSTLNLAGVYVLPNINTARMLGMEGVVALPEWQGLIGPTRTTRTGCSHGPRRVRHGHAALAERVRAQARADDPRRGGRGVRQHSGPDDDHPWRARTTWTTPSAPRWRCTA